MRSAHCVAILGVLITSPLHAVGYISISFWAFDQFAGGTPYYSHYSVTRNDSSNFWNGAGTPETVCIVNMHDSGWGYSETVRSSYHAEAVIGSTGNQHAALRNVGWHNFVYTFDLITNISSISMDGNLIQQGAFSGPLNWFSFNYNGRSYESIIDDFAIRHDGSVIYSQQFESSSLDEGWIVSRLDSGAYVNFNDNSNPRSGSGSLALGGNVSGIVFDLNSVPEPSAVVLSGISIMALCLRRKR
jgi:hypothetical protein